jgi:hypothetical protein
MFTVEKVYYDSFGLRCINRRKEIAVSSKNSGIGNLMFCGQ